MVVQLFFIHQDPLKKTTTGDLKDTQYRYFDGFMKKHPF